MKKLTHSLLFVVVSIVLATGQTPAQQAQEAMDEILKELNAVGLSVAVVKDNQIVYTGAFGAKNIEAGTQIGTDDIFRIASISKSVTATSIMQLFEQGKFNLDDDIGPALKLPMRNPHFPDIPITYRMLLTHTSSLADAGGYFVFDVIDPQKTESVERSYNKYAPGSKYEYCNLGYNLLGALVEIHSEMRFDQYTRKYIFEPLGLNAHFNVDAFDRDQFVTLYDYRNDQFVEAPDAYRSRAADLENYAMGYTTPIFSPTGGLKIAPKDLAIHMLVQMNKGTWNGVQILKPESVEAMQARHTLTDGSEQGYGFAITRSGVIEGESMKGHTGSAYGLLSAMFFEPDKKFGFIMMTNGVAPRSNIQNRVIQKLHEIFIKE